MTLRSAALFAAAALAEIAGVFFIWRTLREDASPLLAVAGALALSGYGLLATLQSDPHFGRVLAAYGGVFVLGSLLWGVVMDRYRPDRFDIVGAGTCLLGAAIIVWAPR